MAKRMKMNDPSSEDQTQKKKDVGGAISMCSLFEDKSHGSSFDNGILSNTTFTSLATVSQQTLRAIENMGFTKMTHIQAECIPQLLSGRDLVGSARTGSGKTLAFLIPIVEMLSSLNCKQGIGCLIVTPTRELTMQTYDILEKLLAYHSLSCGLLMVGSNKETEHEMLSNENVDIVVTTPGRLYSHLKSSSNMRFNNLKCLVLDEADALLALGFQEAIEMIIRALPESRQTILFTATINKQTDDLARFAMKEKPIYVGVGDQDITETSKGLVQEYAVCSPAKRFLFLYTFLNNHHDKKILVFLGTCKAVDFYHSLLNNLGCPVTHIHGRMCQNKRNDTYKKFCDANNAILLSTNLAARGLDIPALDWIVQFDPPTVFKDYFHRVGRTARGVHGQGHSVTVIFPEQMSILQDFKNASVPINEFGYVLSDEDKIQSQINKLLSGDDSLQVKARKGYISYERSLPKKPYLKEVAKSFGIGICFSVIS